MDFSSDEYFGTLGGSLMKDLLADLQVDDGDFSLDQLEKELATLDQEPLQLHHQPIPALDAASLIVSHAQERAGTGSGVTTSAPSQGVDAWSLSLQNFTAMSLQDDFLAADSARKKQQGSAQPMVFEGAEEYDIGEKASLIAPPGLSSRLLSEPPQPFPFPKTPQNSMTIAFEGAGQISDAVEMIPAGAVPSQDKPAATPSSQRADIPAKAIRPQGQVQPPPASLPPQPTPMPGAVQAGAYMPGMPPGVPPSMPMMTPQKMPQHPGMPMPPPHMMTPQVPGQPVVPLVATQAVRGPAWQTPMPAPMPQPIPVYCNPHPAAPPIPCTALQSKYMSARDIAYVVHAILKPILAAGISEDDYYIQFLRRLGGQANPSNPKKPKDINEEMASRANKTKEWSSDKGVLGHVTKSNVARPRALIATPLVATSEDSEQKQRATLWKSRIYCDQAYQSYQTVVDIWRSAPPGAVPPQVQMHLVKLMKCMGITHVDKEYQLDPSSLTLLLKLSKGRTLTARVLEQALLPPNAVQALLPVLLDVLLTLVSKKSADDMTDDVSVERLFRAIAGVMQKLNTSSDTLLQCLEVVLKYGKISLGSAARMESAHTLLQKGSMVVSQDPTDEKRAAWGKAEAEFMNLLQAF